MAHRNERNAKTLRAALLKPTPALWNAIPGRTLLLPGDSGLRHQPWIRCIYPEALIKMQDSAAKHPEDGKLNKFTAPGRWPTPYPTEIHIPRSFPDSDWNTHGR